MIYELSNDTILLYPKQTASGLTTVVYERNRILEFDGSPHKIIKQNCLKNGSNYEGRKAHAKSLMKTSAKLPIVVKEDDRIICFPIKSVRNWDCAWINFYNHRHISSMENGKFLVNSIEKLVIDLNASSFVFSNQVLRSAFLHCEYFR